MYGLPIPGTVFPAREALDRGSAMNRSLAPTLVLVALALHAACASSPGERRTGLRLSAPTYYDIGDPVVITTRSDAGGLRLVIKDSRGTVYYDSKSDPKAGDTRISITFRPPYNAIEPFGITATDATGARKAQPLVRR